MTPVERWCGGRGVRRAALLMLIAALGLLVPVGAAGAEPMTTPVSEPPNTTPTTAPPLCVRVSCAPIGSITVEPGEGVRSTEINISGDCDRTSTTASLVGFIAGGPDPSRWTGTLGTDFDRRTGTFAQVPNPSALFSTAPVDFVPPQQYYFLGECFLYNGEPPLEEYLDPNQPGILLHWLTPPGTFCLYDADNDPAGCTSTPGFDDLARQLGAWGFFSGQFIGQIGAQFTPAAPAPSPPPPETTTTTRRRTTTPTTLAPVPVPDPPPPPPPPCDPNVPPYCPK